MRYLRCCTDQLAALAGIAGRVGCRSGHHCKDLGAVVVKE